MYNKMEYRLKKIDDKHYVIIQCDPPSYRYNGCREVKHVKGDYETALAEFYAFNSRLRKFHDAIEASNALSGITRLVFSKSQSRVSKSKWYNGETI